ncbi:MAG: glycosyltransferase family 2 protein [Deltaproteobacteria bacterium]|nr:glycosyltransferase family 2 protein [Deltaproteobacteria bacterium]
MTEPISTLSVVIPVYNSRDSLLELHERLTKVLSAQADLREYEIVFVEDGGPDDSWDIIREIATSDPRVRGIRHNRNFGQHNALLAGIRAARGEAIVTIDDDLQHPPEEIPKLIAKLNEGHDVVYAPPIVEAHGAWRDFTSVVTKWTLARAMGAKTASDASAWRIFRTRLRDAWGDYRSSFVSIDVLLSWGTTRFAALPLRHEPRRYGRSNYNFAKLFTHAINMITGYSNLPLQLASFIGFFFTAFGILILLFVIGRFLVTGHSVPGFPFLASIIAIFSGAQLFALGIIGEFLARMHFRMLGRPQSVERERIGFDQGR